MTTTYIICLGYTIVLRNFAYGVHAKKWNVRDDSKAPFAVREQPFFSRSLPATDLSWIHRHTLWVSHKKGEAGRLSQVCLYADRSWGYVWTDFGPASVNGMDRISWSCIYSLFLQQRLIDRPWWLYARLLDFLQLSWSEQLWSFPNDPGSSGHYIGNSRVLVQIWSNNRTRGCNNPTKTNTPQVSTHILPSIFQRDGACNYDGFPMIWVVMATTKEFLEFYY
jgi:hypothetical protein